jgi:hypothetical protein
MLIIHPIPLPSHLAHLPLTLSGSRQTNTKAQRWQRDEGREVLLREKAEKVLSAWVAEVGEVQSKG